MVTTDPQAVAWSVELRSSGRLCIDVGRGRAVLLVFGGLLLAGIGAISLTGTPAVAVIGLLLLALGVPCVAWAVRMTLRVGSWRSPHVVVDADGVTVRHGYLHAPWTDLYGAFPYVASHNRWVALVLSPEFYDAWLAERPWPVRLLGRRGRRRRSGSVNLPPNLAVDHVALAHWLHHEICDRRLAELQVLRRAVDDAATATRLEAEKLAEELRGS